MGVIGFKCVDTGENVSFDKCINCALTYENNCNFTADILKGIMEEVTESREKISVTRLIGCPRATYLINRHDVYVSPEKLYWAFRGVLGHAVIERYKADPDAILEKRFARTVGGIKITGKPDIIIPKYELMRDYKTTKEVPYFNRVYPNHEVQLNIYRWLVRKEHKIERLEIVYMDMKKTKIIPLSPKKIWKLSDCEAYVLERASILEKAFKENKTPSVPGEFPLYWQCRDFCDTRDVCAGIYQEELRADFDKWAETEWAQID